MRKFALILSLLSVAVALPSSASAHTLSEGAALEKAFDIARAAYLGSDDAFDYGVERCNRVSRHGFRCKIGVWFHTSDLDWDNYCTRNLSIRYASARSHRLRVWKGKWSCVPEESFPF